MNVLAPVRRIACPRYEFYLCWKRGTPRATIQRAAKEAIKVINAGVFGENGPVSKSAREFWEGNWKRFFEKYSKKQGKCLIDAYIDFYISWDDYTACKWYPE